MPRPLPGGSTPGATGLQLPSPVLIQLGDPGQAGKLLRLSDEFCVDTTNGLVAELRVLLGPDAIQI